MSIHDRKRWLQVIVVFLVVSVMISHYSKGAQTPSDAGQYNRNYFSKDRDPVTAGIVHSVEYWHLNQNLWKAYSSSQWDYVIADLNFVLEKVPNHPTALEILGSVAEISGRKTLPFRYYEKAIALFPREAFTMAQFGDYLVRIDQLDTASSMLDRAIKLDSNIALAYAALAKLYSKQGKTDLATKANDQAKALGYQEGQFKVPSAAPRKP